MRVRRMAAVTAALVVLGTLPAAAVGARYDDALDITFPVDGPATFTDDYHAARGGGTRRHQATDIFAPKLTQVYAAVAGTVCQVTGIDQPVPSYGYQVVLCGDDAMHYSYVHLNNDRPGTDDGAGGGAWAYAPGIRNGLRVTRGQLLGFIGDSGNAEDTPPHLHFSIIDQRLDDERVGEAPYRREYRNPYASLTAARARGEAGGRPLDQGARGGDVAAWQQQLTVVLGAAVATDGAFGPATAEATGRFQQGVGLPAGTVGPRTRAAMVRVLAGGLTATAPPTGDWAGRLLRVAQPLLRGEDVRTWQRWMRDRGWRDSGGGPLTADGVFGAESARVCRLFQQRQGLAADGVVGPRTWAVARP